MARGWRRTRWLTLPGGQRASAEAATMVRPDWRREIDAVIDYFGGAGDARTARSRGWGAGSDQGNRKVLITDGPFAETKEHPGGA
jgi:hypothetical protein